jgi:hypothetical protein
MKLDPSNIELRINGVHIELPKDYEEAKPFRSPEVFTVYPLEGFNFEDINSSEKAKLLAHTLRAIYTLCEKYADEKEKKGLIDFFNKLQTLLKKEGLAVTSECLEYFYSL